MLGLTAGGRDARLLEERVEADVLAGKLEDLGHGPHPFRPFPPGFVPRVASAVVSRPIALLVLLVPVAELFLLLFAGRHLGGGPVLAWLGVTALVGYGLVRFGRQRLASTSMLDRIMGSLGAAPAPKGADPLALVASGVLLMIPGFLTDALGLLALVPGPRRAFTRLMLKRVQGRAMRSMGQFQFPTDPFASGTPKEGAAPIRDVDPSDVEVH